MPFAVKENIDVAGLPTQAGLRLAPPPAAADALCVQRLRASGAILLGHTAMDEAALGATTDNPHYGRTMNPRRDGYTPGGSSGGSAAAVAAGLVAFALGTDTLGSVRIPAAYCGIVGFKPSFGRLGMDGIAPLAPSLDHVGLLAGSVALARRVFAVLVDAPIAAGVARPAVLGIPDVLASVEVEPDVRDRFAEALRRLRASGFATRTISMPGWSPSNARKAAFLLLEALASVVYAKELDDPTGSLSEGLVKMLRFGRECGPERIEAARTELARARSAMDTAFSGIDVLVMPTCPQVAFPFGALPPANQADLTALANVAGLPAISLPLGGDAPDDLPAGLQIIAPRSADARLLDIAEAAEAALGSSL